MGRLAETSQICFPFAFEASNGLPGGAHFGGCSYCATSFFASAIPASRESRLVALDDADAASATRKTDVTASSASRAVRALPLQTLILPSLFLVPSAGRLPP